MIRGVYFVSHKGDLIVSHAAETTAKKKMFTEIFRIEIILSRKKLGAIVKLDDKPTWMVHIEAKEVFLIIVFEGEGCASQILRFIRDLHDMCVKQFNVLSVKNVNDNAVWIQSVLHAAITGGILQPVDRGILESVSKKSFEGVPNTIIQLLPPKMSQMSKRRSIAKSDVFLNIISKIDLILSRNREVLFHNVVVDILMKSSLHPSHRHQLTLTRSSKSPYSDITYPGDAGSSGENIQWASFHPCIDLQTWHDSRKIHFFPPATKESVKLMSFRSIDRPYSSPFIIHTFEKESNGNTRAEMEFKLQANFASRYEARDIVVSIPCPITTSKVNVFCRKGKAKYKPEKSIIRWKIPTMYGQNEELFSAEIICIRPTDGKSVLAHQAPISISFEIPSFNSAGIRLASLRNLQFSTDEITTFIEHMTRSGKYECRVG